MTNKKKKILHGARIALLVAVAVTARFFGFSGIAPSFSGLIRSIIYCYLMLSWGLSVRARVIQVHVRKYLTAVSVLEALWILFRTVKFYFTSVAMVGRMMWYLYYLPMLFIPMLAVFIAMSLGRSENYRLPKGVLALMIPTALLLLMVLTNDYHQLVFTFSPGQVWTDVSYDYAPGFYIVIGWECCLSIAAFIIMVKHCRTHTQRKITPLIFMGSALCYSVLYYFGFRWLDILAGDLTVVQCCLFTLTFESCIGCGLIQANTGYDDLFEVCTLGVQIVDSEYRMRYASLLAPKLPEQIMRQAETAPVTPDPNTLVKSSPIPGGHVLWKEDITELTATLEELEETGRELSQRNYLEQENYKTKQRIGALREKNRLLDLLQQQTISQIDLLDRILEDYEKETEDQNRRRLLAMTAVVGSYIKRCGNLLFISESTQTFDIAEFTRCIEESFNNLELLGASCGYDLPSNEAVLGADAIRAYRILETITEASMEDLVSVWLKGRTTERDILLRLEVCCQTDLTVLSGIADGFSPQDGAFCFTIRIRKGGEQP